MHPNAVKTRVRPDPPARARVYPVCFNEVDDIPYMVTVSTPRHRIYSWCPCKTRGEARKEFTSQVDVALKYNMAVEVVLWKLPAGTENPHRYMDQEMSECRQLQHFQSIKW